MRLMSILPRQTTRNGSGKSGVWRGIYPKSPRSISVALAERLIRMFSFVGDTVLDPFLGTGTTSVAAARCGRNSIGGEIDPDYFALCIDRVRTGVAAAGQTALDLSV